MEEAPDPNQGQTNQVQIPAVLHIDREICSPDLCVSLSFFISYMKGKQEILKSFVECVSQNKHSINNF